MGNNACYGVGLKSAQSWGCPCSIKCLFKDIRSALTPSLRISPFSCWLFWKLADRCKCAQPKGEICAIQPFPFVVGVDNWLRSWLCDKGVSYTKFFFECSLRAGIFKQSMGARNRVGIGLSYQPAGLPRLAEFIPWNRFLGSINT